MTTTKLLLGYVNTNTPLDETQSLPLGLQFVGAAAKSCGWDVRASYWGSEVTTGQFASDVAAASPDLFGLYVDMVNVYTVGRLLRRIPPECRPVTILGGPEATFNHRAVAETCGADIVVRGAGEPVVLALARGDYHDPAFLETIPGLSFRTGGRWHHTGTPSYDDIPAFLPDRSLLGDNREVLYLLTSRGCPHRCSFCSEASVPYRPRPLDEVYFEVETALQQSLPQWILIVDDNFTAEAGRARRIAAYFGEHYRGPWSCEVTARSICSDDTLARDLASSGLTRVQIGIESMNNETLSLYRKGVTAAKTREAVSRLIAGGVRCVFGNFIVGAPDESEALIQNNMAAAREWIHEYPGQVELSASILSYNPGAPFFDRPERFGLHFTDESILSATDLRSPVSPTRHIPATRILQLHEEFNQLISAEVEKVLPHVPRAVVRLHLSFEKKGLSTMWSKLLLGHRHLATYYTLVYQDESHLDIEDIDIKQIDEEIPQRTRIQVQLSMKGNVVLSGFPGEYREMNDTASYLYEMCNGKHRILDIVDMLRRRLPAGDRTPREQIRNDVVRFCQELAESFQLVFVAQ